MPVSTSVKLNTGAEMPTLGLGTWKSQPGAVGVAVTHALKHGYKSIDTAAAYGNEAEVGQGIKNSGVARDQFFLTTKLNNNDHKDVEGALNSSLQKLGTNYLDLWLMHWPAPMNADCTEADKSCLSGLNLNLSNIHGVSNFSIKFLTRLLENSDVVPAVNQIELHPSCPQQELVDLCRSKGIIVTAYSPLGSDNSPLLTDPIVTKLAEKHNVQPANVLVSLQANRPSINVLAKSVTPSRIETNSKIVDLTEEEITELQSIDKKKHFRVCHPSWTGWGSLGFDDCLDADNA
ncbi:Glycerol 2-dehydrogenase (NADP(+)) [Leucoagaricus sp. SymC.cos]|nr:Glycerol 2-dehydrogenase (NADP(+)) [Leucoagaricus sp. SymC.cos]